MKHGKVMVVVASVLFLFACGDDEEETVDAGNGGHEDELFPECDEIREACHDVDDGTGVPAMCHGEIAHENDRAACIEHLDHCLAACEQAAADGGTHGDEDGGEHDEH